MEHQEHISDRREIDKLSLETFLFDKTNLLDFDIDKLIKMKQDEIEKNHLELCRINESPEKNQTINDFYEENGFSLWDHEHSLIQDMQYYEDDVFVLYEVKIIYAYKHFEINLKKLLCAAYRDQSVKKIFHWHEVAGYLKLKGIDIKKIDQYLEINQLRNVNNALKHSGEIDKDEIKKITEFEKKTTFHTSDLDVFYNRVKESSNKFLSSISKEIFRNLYEFDEPRLQEIAKHFAMRMDENVAARFAEILKDIYK